MQRSHAESISPTRSNLFITPRSCPMMVHVAKKASTVPAEASDLAALANAAPTGAVPPQHQLPGQHDLAENTSPVFTKGGKPVIFGSKGMVQQRASKHVGACHIHHCSEQCTAQGQVVCTSCMNVVCNGGVHPRDSSMLVTIGDDVLPVLWHLPPSRLFP